MSIEYDEKGKFYTNVISKVAVPSLVQTTTHLIRGDVHIRQGERFKDELEGDGHYVAVTNASVYGADGSVNYSAPFLAVQKGQIVWIMPMEEGDNKEEG
ncbi:MAG: hypothetical protein C4557_11115 [Anaerolineaceae bacterium]|jgi:hypothetical protein|nr:MAG: hypothetical protein C4557_11115 [Anaerolineaceae bacterium]